MHMLVCADLPRLSSSYQLDKKKKKVQWDETVISSIPPRPSLSFTFSSTFSPQN